MARQDRSRNRGADTPAAVLGDDVLHPRDTLDVDNEFRLHQARTQGDEKIGAAGKDPCGARA